MCPLHGVGHWLGAPGTAWMVLAGLWDSSMGESVPHIPTLPPVHLHVQTDHPTACTAPELPQDTLCPCMHCQLTPTGPCTHLCCPYRTLCHPTQSPVQSCPTALAPQDTPHHPTVSVLFSPCSFNHSHFCLLAEPRAPLPQPLSCAGPGAAPDCWAGRTLGRATGSALGIAGSTLGKYTQWCVVGPVCSK